MRIALLTDTHAGIRNNSLDFLNNAENFFSKQFFPIIDKEKVEHVIHLGDIVDNRNSINFNTLSRLKKEFITPLQKRRLPMTILVGNHDSYFKNTIVVNSLETLFDNTDYLIHIINKPITKKFGHLDIDLYPWICEDNFEDVQKMLKKKTSTYAMGHFEFQGFNVLTHKLSEEGLDSNLFNKYNKVYSGHFHIKSARDNVSYIGSAMELNWNDVDTEKGFYIFDTNDIENMQFFKNTTPMFKQIVFSKNMSSSELKDCKNKFVKVYISSDITEEEIGNFIKKLENQNCIDIEINHEFVSNETDTIINEIIETDGISNHNNITLLEKFIRNKFSNDENIMAYASNLMTRAQEMHNDSI